MVTINNCFKNLFTKINHNITLLIILFKVNRMIFNYYKIMIFKINKVHSLQKKKK